MIVSSVRCMFIKSCFVHNKLQKTISSKQMQEKFFLKAERFHIILGRDMKKIVRHITKLATTTMVTMELLNALPFSFW